MLKVVSLSYRRTSPLIAFECCNLKRNMATDKSSDNREIRKIEVQMIEVGLYNESHRLRLTKIKSLRLKTTRPGQVKLLAKSTLLVLLSRQKHLRGS